MQRMLRRGVFVLAATTLCVLAVGAASGSSDTGLGLQTVNLACSDGTSTNLSLDLGTLSLLTDSVGAMSLYPAGLTCSLGQSNPSSASGKAFVVGGGRYDRAECPINFSINGHIDSNGAHGTQTATESNAPGGIPGCPGEGHVKADVTCVAVSGNRAEVRGDVIEQSCSLGPEFFPPGDTVFVTDVIDNGNPSAVLPDEIVQSVDATGTEQNCDAGVQSFYFPVDNGNITVHGS
jgi:hypothetical protein